MSLILRISIIEAMRLQVQVGCRSTPKTDEHNARTSEEVLTIIRAMAGRLSDEAITACLNSMGTPTGQGKT